LKTIKDFYYLLNLTAEQAQEVIEAPYYLRFFDVLTLPNSVLLRVPEDMNRVNVNTLRGVVIQIAFIG